MADISIVNGGYKPTTNKHHWGPHHIAWNGSLSLPIDIQCIHGFMDYTPHIKKKTTDLVGLD